MAAVDESALVDGILDSLEDVGYTGPLFEEGALEAAMKAGLASELFTDLCISLCVELKALLELSEAVSPPNGVQDEESFQLEMRAFLVELSCPHSVLTQDLAALAIATNRILLVDFLLSELLTARLLSLRKQQLQDEQDSKLQAQGSPYDVACNLEAVLKVFGVSKPPPHVTTKMVFDRIIGKVKEAVTAAPKGYLSSPLVKQPLTIDQWALVDVINDTLVKEYSVRRRMILTRCDVTVQSFMWSEKAKEKEDELAATYQAHRDQLMESAPVLIARVLAAKQELMTVDRTSSGEARKATQCSINKVLIGHVPDRGGRPRETRPPPEMPGFKQRTQPPQEKRDRGQSGGRGKRGGRVQGGWGGGRGGGGGYSGGWGGHGGYSGGWGGGGGGGGYYDPQRYNMGQYYS